MRTHHSQKHSMENTVVRFKPKHYDPEFKKKVVSFAERRGNQEAKRRFGVNESNIRRWRKIQRDLALEKAAGRNVVATKKPRRKQVVVEDIPNKIGMEIKDTYLKKSPHFFTYNSLKYFCLIWIVFRFYAFGTTFEITYCTIHFRSRASSS